MDHRASQIPSSPRAGRRWLAFILWTSAIFVAVPFANQIQGWISDHLGENAVRLALSFLLLASVAVSLRLIRRGFARVPWVRLLWTLAIAAVALAVTWRLRVAAEPAHLAEYGILAMLAFRALAVHLRDQGVYLAAVALTAIVGTLDEIFQWLLPDRYWDPGDLGLNVGAGLLMQALIALGIRPPLAPGVSARSLRITARLAAAEVLLLLLCLANTPARIDAYAARIGLEYLGKGPGTRMTEYGHLYQDPEIGRFRSRLTPEALRLADRRQGPETAKALDLLRTGPGGRLEKRYYRHLRHYPPSRAPFEFEAGTHLFYRERMWQRARSESDWDERARLATIAFRENLILERYFTLASSGARLEEEARRRMAALHRPQAEFDSEVSDWLITRFSEAQARWFLLAVLFGLGVVERSASRRLVG